MQPGERILRALILAVYAATLARLSWTGGLYRFASPASAAFSVVAAPLFLAAAVAVLLPRQPDAGSSGSALSAVARGGLYALSLFPAAALWMSGGLFR